MRRPARYAGPLLHCPGRLPPNSGRRHPAERLPKADGPLSPYAAVDAQPPKRQLASIKSRLPLTPILLAMAACNDKQPKVDVLCFATINRLEHPPAFIPTGITSIGRARYVEAAADKARATYDGLRMDVEYGRNVSTEQRRSLEAAKRVADNAEGESIAFLKRNDFSPYRLTFTSRDDLGRAWNTSRYCGANERRCECFRPL